MAGIRWSIIIVLMLLIPIFTVTADEAETEAPTRMSPTSRHIEIPYTEDPPDLDGNLGASEWKSFITGWYFDGQDGMSFQENYSDPVNGFDESLGDQKDVSAWFYVLYDDEYLYIGANVTDDTIVVDSYSIDPTKFYRDDGIEILIDGGP